jgi:hypothetical protein
MHKINQILVIILIISAVFTAQNANSTAPVTIEAEECEKVNNCKVEGKWKPWDMGEFSNGRLLTNENPKASGKSLNTELHMTFQGGGVVVVYRQDTWYGMLGVQIDKKSVEYINQKGDVVKNQTEACFEIEDNEEHSLILSGSKKKGIITLDAVKILPEGASCPPKK